MDCMLCHEPMKEVEYHLFECQNCHCLINGWAQTHTLDGRCLCEIHSGRQAA